LDDCLGPGGRRRYTGRPLDAGGRTIGVIGTPLTHAYPQENAYLQAEIAHNFLLISQMPVLRYEQSWKERRQYFPERNVTMSALTAATIIVEASDTSGTLYQARAALRQKRKLFILESCFHVPGLTWPHRYAEQGALRSAALADGLPMLGLRWTGELLVEGRARSGPPIEFNHRVVSEDYFRTLGVTVRRGRPFTAGDRPPAARVVIVNEALVRRCCGRGDLLGQRISFRREGGGDSGWMTVVGVVANEKLEGLAQEPWPEVFEPYLQDSQMAMALAVRPTLPPARLGRDLEGGRAPARPRAAARPRPAARGHRFRVSLLRQRSLVVLLAGFAGIALALGLKHPTSLWSELVT
jgi:hypothetical protein